MLASRGYQSENDLQQMLDLLVEGRLRTDDWRYPHVGDLLWTYFMVASHLKPQEFIRVWHEPGGRLVGFAIFGEDPSIEWQVLPEYEWRGIEAEALTWADRKLSELRDHDPQWWRGDFICTTRQDNARRIAFLEQHGFRYRSEFTELNLLRELEAPVPAARLPPGWQVRELRETGEIGNRAAAQREVWHLWSVGEVSDEDYAALMRLPGYQRELDVVAVAPDGVIAAYVNGWIDPRSRTGDFGPLGTRRAYRRQGLARAALCEGLRRMQAAGMQRVCVSTGVNNEPAIRLYESLGFKIVNQTLDFEQMG